MRGILFVGILVSSDKSQRSIVAKLRGSTAPLQIEMGRWRGVPREERLCRYCDLEKVEDAEHCRADEMSCLANRQCLHMQHPQCCHLNWYMGKSRCQDHHCIHNAAALLKKVCREPQLKVFILEMWTVPPASAGFRGSTV